MLQDDNSWTMMLFFGYVGLLNAACLGPVLLILHVAGFVSFGGLSGRVFLLTVCKGRPHGLSSPNRAFFLLWVVINDEAWRCVYGEHIA
jgi:hypothetical protein